MDRVGDEKEPTGKDGIPFFPDHVLKEGIVFFILLGLLVTLAIFRPFELGEKANPLKTPYAIKPEWYFLPMYHVLKYFPKLFGIFVVSLAPLLLILWPFLDRGLERHPLKRPIAMTLGALTILSLILLGMLGHLSETKQSFFGKTYEFDIYGIPHRSLDSQESNE